MKKKGTERLKGLKAEREAGKPSDFSSSRPFSLSVFQPSILVVGIGAAVCLVLLAAAFPRLSQSRVRASGTDGVVFAYQEAGAWEACASRYPGVFAYASEAGFGVLSSGTVTATVAAATVPVPPEYPLLVTPPDRMIPPPMAPAPLAEVIWHPRLTSEQIPSPPAERFVMEMDEALRARELTLTGLTAETFAGTTRPVGKVEVSLRLTEEGRVTDVVFLPGHTLDLTTLRLVEDSVKGARALPGESVTQGRLRLRWRTQGDVW